MDKERRHLIQDELQKLQEEYEARVEEAKAKNEILEAYGMAIGSQAILRAKLAILQLDAQDKI